MDSADQKFNIVLPSALFPFRLVDLARFEHGPYTLTNVYQTISHEQKLACISLWSRNGISMSYEEAMKRTEQVCYYITETETGKLVGVNTIYLDSIVAGGPKFILNRMFIAPKYRNTRLMITGTAMMLCYAKTELSEIGASGVVNINENTKLSRKGMKRIFSNLGYKSQGLLRGQEVLYFEFARITLTEIS